MAEKLDEKLAEKLADTRIPTVIYCRKSRKDLESIERQKDIVRHFVDSDYSLRYCYTYEDDGFTGTDFDRPGWKRMMKDLERGLVKCLVVKDLSRIGRNTQKVTELLEETFPSMGVRVLSIAENYDSDKGDDPTQAMVTGIFNIANQYEADNAQRKVRQSLRLKMERNESLGRVPYGYRKVGTGIVPDEDTRSVVEMIFDLAQLLGAEGSRGVAAKIVTTLNEQSIPAPNGGAWGENTVKRILQNPAYCGKYVAHKEERNRRKRMSVPEEEQIVKEDNHPAIVSSEQYEAVQKLFGWGDSHGQGDNHSQEKPESGHDNKLTDDPLKGIAKCGSCGRSLAYIRPNEKTGVKTAKYYCRNHTGAKATGELMEKRPEITEDALEQKIVEACNACVDSIESGDPVMLLVEEEDRWYSSPELKEWLERLKTQQSSGDTELMALYDEFCDGKITKDDFILHRDKWQEEKAKLEKEIRKVMIMENRVSIADVVRRDMKGQLPKMIGFDPDRVKRMVDKVLLNPDGTLTVVFEEKTRMLAETRVRVGD